MRTTNYPPHLLRLSAGDLSSVFEAGSHCCSIGLREEDSVPPTPRSKRVMDLCVILLGLPVVLLVGGLVALWIKCASPGPVFFRQKRIGLRGRPFTCLKFRSMHAGADSDSHRRHVQHLIQDDAPMQKLDAHDPRLIPLGHLLRASGLDELPQLLNVLRGEMSLVGPRPCLPYEFERYLPWQKRRCDVLPSLTGLWQVSGKNHTTFNQMIEMDLRYARSGSFTTDVRILFKTFGALLRQVGESTVGASGSQRPPQRWRTRFGKVAGETFNSMHCLELANGAGGRTAGAGSKRFQVGAQLRGEASVQRRLDGFPNGCRPCGMDGPLSMERG